MYLSELEFLVVKQLLAGATRSSQIAKALGRQRMGATDALRRIRQKYGCEFNSEILEKVAADPPRKWSPKLPKPAPKLPKPDKPTKPSRSHPIVCNGLTELEENIAHLICSGISQTEAAHRLGYSRSHIYDCVRVMRKKLDTPTLNGMIVKLIQLGYGKSIDD